MAMFGSTKKERKKITRKEWQELTRVFAYIKPYKWYFIVGLIMLIASSAIFMIFPGAAGEMANTAVGKGKFNISVSQYIWVFAAILISQGVMSYIRTMTFAVVSEKGMADLRQDTFTRLLRFKMEGFEQNRIGELTSRVTADIEKLQSAFSITLAEFIRQFVLLIGGVGILVWLAPKLCLIMILTFPVIVVLAILFGRRIRKISANRQEYVAKSNGIIEEVLQSFKVVKAFGNEWYESVRYRKSLTSIVKISLNVARQKGLFFVFIITILFGGVFFILWRGALMVENGEMLIGDLFSFIMYTALIGGAIAGIGNLYTELAGAVGATERIFSLLDEDIEPIDLSQPEGTIAKLSGKIDFDDVHFTYPSRPDIEILKGIDLHIAPGEKIALVGSSGAGKSTIVSLLMHFYEIHGGSITIDGRPLEDIPLSELRQNMAIVPQDISLFGGTIRENILYGNPNASEAEVIEAAKKANAWKFIQKFPEGLDTLIGDRGLKLSGGQQQRVAIARAILRDPAILLLDEATSSLDAESEKLVQEALSKLMEGRTSIIIAHRLSTIRDVDKIYVIHDGKVAEVGTHDELIQDQEGLYYNLAKLQLD